VKAFKPNADGTHPPIIWLDPNDPQGAADALMLALYGTKEKGRRGAGSAPETRSPARARGKRVTDNLPVIDLDDTIENMSWLRIVSAMRQHDAGELTDEQYAQRLAELRGEVPPSDPGDPGVLWSHDPASRP